MRWQMVVFITLRPRSPRACLGGYCFPSDFFFFSLSTLNCKSGLLRFMYSGESVFGWEKCSVLTEGWNSKNKMPDFFQLYVDALSKCRLANAFKPVLVMVCFWQVFLFVKALFHICLAYGVTVFQLFYSHNHPSLQLMPSAVKGPTGKGLN